MDRRAPNTITRRTALAASVTLPLLPVASLATSIEADPAVAAFREWRADYIAYERSFDRPHVPDDCPIMIAAGDAEWRAKTDLASMIATTPAGLAGQLRMGLGIFGSLFLAGSDFSNPTDYEFDNCRDDMDGRLYRNMLTAAERMAGVST